MISEEFEIKNSKAYHKTSLKETNQNGISYITRTNLNNGVEAIVENQDFITNKPNTIVFGAENATFFYQPNEYITGNKMYYIQNKKINKYSGLFLQLVLNKSIDNCGFGYGKGLTGTRVQKRYISLPVNKKGEPDFEFMETFMKQKEIEKINQYYKFVKDKIVKSKDFQEVSPLEKKEWSDFKITTFFNFAKGDQNNMANLEKGIVPLVSAKKGDNGCKDFASQKNKKLFKKNSLTLNNDGDGGAGISFYQPFDYLLDSHVTALYPKMDLNKYVLLFISRCITAQRNKFGHGYSINNQRLKVLKIMLPIDEKGQPDYEYMENYIKKIEYKKRTKYIEIKTTNA